MSNSYIRPKDKSQSGAPTSGQSGHGHNDNERALYIPQSSSFTLASSSDCFVSYPGECNRGILQTQPTGPINRLIDR